MSRFRILAALYFVCGIFLASSPAATASDGGRFTNFSVDAGAASTTSPADGWENATGLSLGLVYRLSNNAGIRVAVERYKFTATSSTTSYTRIPVFLGGRFYFWNMGDIWSHADLGMEMSMDEMQPVSGVGSTTETQSNMGGAALYGILYEISDHLFMGANGKIHLNKNSYWSYGIYLGMVF